MADTRDFKILGIWARLAGDPPATPITGVAYRNIITMDQAEFEEGWPFDTLVDSADFNEKMFAITSLLLELDEQGIIGWNDDVDYGARAMVRGSDGIYYVSTVANGPATAVVDPVGDGSGTWITLSADLGVGGGFDIDALPDGTAITLLSADRIAFSDQSDTQTDKFTNMQAVQDFMQTNLTFGGVDIDALPAGAPDSADLLIFSDQSDTGTEKKATIADIVAASGSGAGLIDEQFFVASGTWNKPAGTNKVRITVVAGGGGGSGAGSDGTSGGTSSFGAHASATGGAGGNASTGDTNEDAVAGGVGSGGDANIRGSSSENVNQDAGGTAEYGGGGSSALGGSTNISGSIGANFGGGGCGTSGGSGAGTGGGGGGTALKFITAGLGASETITVGSGGTGNGGGGNGAGGIIIVRSYT